jgi:hypothetical protein
MDDSPTIRPETRGRKAKSPHRNLSVFLGVKIPVDLHRRLEAARAGTEAERRAVGHGDGWGLSDEVRNRLEDSLDLVIDATGWAEAAFDEPDSWMTASPSLWQRYTKNG